MTRSERRSEGGDRLSLVSFGFFLVLIGAIIFITPNYYNEFSAFFRDFHLVKVASNFFLPAPKSSHPVVYTAIMEFCVAYGLFQIAILSFRFALRDPVDRKAGTVSGIVFWLGAGYLSSILLAGSIGWFAFLAGLIVFIGLAILIRSFVTLSFQVVKRGVKRELK